MVVADPRYPFGNAMQNIPPAYQMGYAAPSAPPPQDETYLILTSPTGVVEQGYARDMPPYRVFQDFSQRGGLGLTWTGRGTFSGMAAEQYALQSHGGWLIQERRPDLGMRLIIGSNPEAALEQVGGISQALQAEAQERVQAAAARAGGLEARVISGDARATNIYAQTLKSVGWSDKEIAEKLRGLNTSISGYVSEGTAMDFSSMQFAPGAPVAKIKDTTLTRYDASGKPHTEKIESGAFDLYKTEAQLKAQGFNVSWNAVNELMVYAPAAGMGQTYWTATIGGTEQRFATEKEANDALYRELTAGKSMQSGYVKIAGKEVGAEFYTDETGMKVITKFIGVTKEQEKKYRDLLDKQQPAQVGGYTSFDQIIKDRFKQTTETIGFDKEGNLTLTTTEPSKLIPGTATTTKGYGELTIEQKGRIDTLLTEEMASPQYIGQMSEVREVSGKSNMGLTKTDTGWKFEGMQQWSDIEDMLNAPGGRTALIMGLEEPAPGESIFQRAGMQTPTWEDIIYSPASPISGAKMAITGFLGMPIYKIGKSFGLIQDSPAVEYNFRNIIANANIDIIRARQEMDWRIQSRLMSGEQTQKIVSDIPVIGGDIYAPIVLVNLAEYSATPVGIAMTFGIGSGLATGWKMGSASLAETENILQTFRFIPPALATFGKAAIVDIKYGVPFMEGISVATQPGYVPLKDVGQVTIESGVAVAGGAVFRGAFVGLSAISKVGVGAGTTKVIGEKAAQLVAGAEGIGVYAPPRIPYTAGAMPATLTQAIRGAEEMGVHAITPSASTVERTLMQSVLIPSASAGAAFMGGTATYNVMTGQPTTMEEMQESFMYGSVFGMGMVGAGAFATQIPVFDNFQTTVAGKLTTLSSEMKMVMTPKEYRTGFGEKSPVPAKVFGQDVDVYPTKTGAKIVMAKGMSLKVPFKTQMAREGVLGQYSHASMSEEMRGNLRSGATFKIVETPEKYMGGVRKGLKETPSGLYSAGYAPLEETFLKWEKGIKVNVKKYGTISGHEAMIEKVFDVDIGIENKRTLRRQMGYEGYFGIGTTYSDVVEIFPKTSEKFLTKEITRQKTPKGLIEAIKEGRKTGDFTKARELQKSSSKPQPSPQTMIGQSSEYEALQQGEIKSGKYKGAGILFEQFAPRKSIFAPEPKVKTAITTTKVISELSQQSYNPRKIFSDTYYKTGIDFEVQKTARTIQPKPAQERLVGAEELNINYPENKPYAPPTKHFVEFYNVKVQETPGAEPVEKMMTKEQIMRIKGVEKILNYKELVESMSRQKRPLLSTIMPSQIATGVKYLTTSAKGSSMTALSYQMESSGIELSQSSRQPSSISYARSSAPSEPPLSRISSRLSSEPSRVSSPISEPESSISDVGSSITSSVESEIASSQPSSRPSSIISSISSSSLSSSKITGSSSSWFPKSKSYKEGEKTPRRKMIKLIQPKSIRKAIPDLISRWISENRYGKTATAPSQKVAFKFQAANVLGFVPTQQMVSRGAYKEEYPRFGQNIYIGKLGNINRIFGKKFGM